MEKDSAKKDEVYKKPSLAASKSMTNLLRQPEQLAALHLPSMPDRWTQWHQVEDRALRRPVDALIMTSRTNSRVNLSASAPIGWVTDFLLRRRTQVLPL